MPSPPLHAQPRVQSFKKARYRILGQTAENDVPTPRPNTPRREIMNPLPLMTLLHSNTNKRVANSPTRCGTPRHDSPPPTQPRKTTTPRAPRTRTSAALRTSRTARRLRASVLMSSTPSCGVPRRRTLVAHGSNPPGSSRRCTR